MNDKFDVFISYKKTEDGKLTEDYSIAKELHNSLISHNIRSFFSDESIFTLGKSDYKKAIDSALESSTLLVVIGTKESYLLSGWVEYEYETFCEDILSERKKSGSIISYTKNITPNSLPRTLSRFQNYFIDETSVDRITGFITNLMLSQNDVDHNRNDVGKYDDEKDTRRCKWRDSRKASAYASDYSNELKRLEIQSYNSRKTDAIALNYIFEQNLLPIEKKINILDIGSAYGYVAADRFEGLDRVGKILCIDKNARVIERAEIIFAEKEKMCFETIDIEADDFEEKLQSALSENDIDTIQLFYSALTLHHLKDPNKLLRRIRKFMSSESVIVLRGSDDGSKMCFPRSELMEEIIEKTSQAPGVSDRYNGRKIYAQLTNAGFRGIRVFSDMKDISEFDYDDRGALFEESFAYRVNYFKREVEENPSNTKAKEDLEWMEEALEEFETQFYESNFWYCEHDYIGVALK